MVVIATMNVGGDIFSSSSIHESMKKKLDDQESIIIELRQCLFENRQAQHLGCNSEIEKLKSQIVSKKQKSILQSVSLLYTLDKNYLREQQFEQEVQNLRIKLVELKSDLQSTKNVVQQKEKKHS